MTPLEPVVCPDCGAVVASLYPGFPANICDKCGTDLRPPLPQSRAPALAPLDLSGITGASGSWEWCSQLIEALSARADLPPVVAHRLGVEILEELVATDFDRQISEIAGRTELTREGIIHALARRLEGPGTAPEPGHEQRAAD